MEEYLEFLFNNENIQMYGFELTPEEISEFFYPCTIYEKIHPVKILEN